MIATTEVRIPTARGSVHVRRTGDGKRRVLCLHPLASSGAFWDPLARYLGRAATILAPDARGHGASSWDGSTFTVEDMAEDAASVIGATGGGPVGVIGMSMGGCVAMALAARHPELVDSLVLADTTSCYGPERIEKWTLRASSARTKSRPEQVDFQLERWFSDQFKAAHPDEVQRVVGIFLSTDSAAHAAACMALGAFDGTADLERIEVQTLVIVGELDQATPPAMAEVLADRIAHATLYVIPQVKHLSLIEDQEGWARIAGHLVGGAPAG